MEQKKYAEAIENKDASKALEYFNRDLEKFVLKCRRLKKAHQLAENEESRSRLRIMFARTWTKFLRGIPFPHIDMCKNGDVELRISEILPKNSIVDGYEKNLKGLLNYVVRYVAFILKENNLAYRELIIYSSLRFVLERMEVSSMRIMPSFVVEMVDDVMSEIGRGVFKQPRATLYEGKLYEGQKLSSSQKAAVYRGRRLCEFADSFITEYRHCNQGKLPTREELKNYLITECALSGDERLKVFSKKMNDKTLNKLIIQGGYQTLISRRRKPLPNVVQPSTELSKEKKMTLREVFEYLKEGINYHDKNYIEQ